MLKKVVIYFLCLHVFVIFSQTSKHKFIQRELGFLVGGCYYIGDINPRFHFLETQPALGLFFRYSRNYRTAFRFGVNYGQITATDALSSEANQLERNLNFKSDIVELNSTAEFNFVDYRIGHKNYKFTMYLFAGVSAFYFNPTANIGNGEKELRDLKTEGQIDSYSKIQISIPFGIGFKLNLGKKCGIGIEWGPRKTFTDYLDDLSGAYPETFISSKDASNFTDRTLNSSALAGGMRGNPNNDDWYFFYGLSFNVKLPDQSKNCYGKGKSKLKGSLLTKFISIF